MNKAELKETLDKLDVRYEDDATNKELEALIELNNNPLDDSEEHDNSSPDDDLSDSDSSISDAQIPMRLQAILVQLI